MTVSCDGAADADAAVEQQLRAEFAADGYQRLSDVSQAAIAALDRSGADGGDASLLRETAGFRRTLEQYRTAFQLTVQVREPRYAQVFARAVPASQIVRLVDEGVAGLRGRRRRVRLDLPSWMYRRYCRLRPAPVRVGGCEISCESELFTVTDFYEVRSVDDRLLGRVYVMPGGMSDAQCDIYRVLRDDELGEADAEFAARLL